MRPLGVSGGLAGLEELVGEAYLDHRVGAEPGDEVGDAGLLGG